VARRIMGKDCIVLYARSFCMLKHVLLKFLEF